MFEDGDLFLFADFMKIVHVELANEGRKFIMLEILGQDLI